MVRAATNHIETRAVFFRFNSTRVHVDVDVGHFSEYTFKEQKRTIHVYMEILET